MPRRNQRSSFDQVSEFDRERIVDYRDCELSFKKIGSRVGRNQTTVMRICDRWMQEGTSDRRVRSHPPQCTISRADRYREASFRAVTLHQATGSAKAISLLIDLYSNMDCIRVRQKRIVDYRDCELSFKEIGSRVGRNQTIVMRICDRWMQEGTSDRRVRSHPPQCTISRADSVVMKSNREFENRAAIIVALRAGRSPKEIVDFLKLPKTTIYRVKKQFDEADSNKEGIATRKKHSRRSDRVRGEEFVKNVKEKIDGNPGKSMRAIAKEMDVGSMTIVRTIHEDLGLKSYALRKGQLLTENMKNNRKGKAAALLNNLKHDSFGMLRFFSDEKYFDVDQKVNPRNDRWICKDPSEIPVVMHTKFPASVMVLGVISSEDCNPLDYYVWGVVERDVNKAPHTTIQSVKKAVHTVMTQMDKVIVAKACASFRTRLETVVANNGNYIE
ncbi:IKK1 [Cordylochernes scorpioides]|uniref:IKK1 n=1 Tax=Cordylochernes scorpioides TaxID=51811 RepID=A0ABY6KZB7_9ARAC|nr:IKK1 [Cordylochernes scorpioides]